MVNAYVASKGSPETGTFPVLVAANWPTVLHEATKLGARRFVRVGEGKWTDNPAGLAGIVEWWIVRLPLIE